MLDQRHESVAIDVKIKLMLRREQRGIEVRTIVEMTHFENCFQRASAVIVVRNLKERPQNSVVYPSITRSVDQAGEPPLDIAAQNQSASQEVSISRRINAEDVYMAA